MDKYTGFDIDSKKTVGVRLAGVWPDFPVIDLLLGNTYSQGIQKSDVRNQIFLSSFLCPLYSVFAVRHPVDCILFIARPLKKAVAISNSRTVEIASSAKGGLAM